MYFQCNSLHRLLQDELNFGHGFRFDTKLIYACIFLTGKRNSKASDRYETFLPIFKEILNGVLFIK